jgi:hypothetical protein
VWLILGDENLPLIEVDIFDLLDCSTDDELNLLDHSNITRSPHQLCAIRVVDMDQVPPVCFTADVRGCQ